MITGIEVLKAVLEADTALDKLAAQFARYPQELVNVRVRSKPPFESLPEVKAESERLERDLEGRGRLLLRYSGTENLARVMIEGKDQATVKAQANRLAELIRNAIGE